MKFINFSQPENDGLRLGCYWDSQILDVTRAVSGGVVDFPIPLRSIEDVLHTPKGLPTLVSSLLRLKSASPNIGDFLLQFQDVKIAAPILHPEKLIGIGLNYKDHAEESGVPLPKSPLLFGMYANAIIGPDEPIRIPPLTTRVDYEAELGVVMGSRAFRVPASEALDYVAGYTIVHDVSARDLQFGEKQWTRGKSIDTFAPMGPCLVTQADLGAADNLKIESRLNGKTMQKSNTSNLIFNVAALVAHISETMTLMPGDVISTGTPAGVGYVRNPPVFLKEGDVVEIEIEGIGVLRNPVMNRE